jgi:hypothetical protein
LPAPLLALGSKPAFAEVPTGDNCTAPGWRICHNDRSEQTAAESSIAADTAAAAALPEHKDCFAYVAFVVKSFAAADLHTEIVAYNQILTAVAAAAEELVEWSAADNRR